MADDPRKKGRDRKTVSQQPHEQRYQRKKSNRRGQEEDISGRDESRGENRMEERGRSGSGEER